MNLQDGADTVSLDSVTNGGNQPLGVAVTVNSGIGAERVRLQNGREVTASGLRNVINIPPAGTTATLNGVAVNFAPTPPPANWFDSNITDAALRSLGKTLYADNAINRSDIMALFTSAGDNGAVDATELADLQKIVNNSVLFAGAYHVERLAEYVVLGSGKANAKYQGQTLGNLVVGSTTAQLGNLVNKWFLGLDHPTATGAYRQFAGQLFVNGAAYTDIHQGSLGDCYLLASLAEVALRTRRSSPTCSSSTATAPTRVRFYHNGVAEFVTVDSFLPTNAGGNCIYARSGQTYAQRHATNSGPCSPRRRTCKPTSWVGFARACRAADRMPIAAIEGGYIYAALGHITGQATRPFTSTMAGTSFPTFVNAWNRGKSIGFASK